MSDAKLTWGKRLRDIQKERKCALFYLAIDTPSGRYSLDGPITEKLAYKLFHDCLAKTRDDNTLPTKENP